jgi:pyridoxamine 5'-phosphate oxidase
MKDLSNYRKSYEKSQLTESEIPGEPLALFHKWFQEAEDLGGADEVNAMTVSSIGLDGFPKSRIVLLKQVTEKGFVFFTNYASEKGRAIAANPNVCLSFFWAPLERQVIIKGIATKTHADVSDAYFDSRPEGSRLGAIASDQSQVIESRQVLEDRLEQLKQEMAFQKIERPKHWGGYIVEPVEVEFWQGRQNRLHDRIRYRRAAAGAWTADRLAP